jgi:hypothetical protein
LHLVPRNGRYTATLDSYVVVDSETADKPQHQETRLDLAIPAEAFKEVERSGLPIRRELALAPGRYQARVLIRDQTSGLLGSVRHRFEVPPATGLQVSTPIVTDSFQPGEGGQRRPLPVAHRTFAPGATLACAFTVLGAKPDPAGGGARVSLSYRLRRAGGGEVMASPARSLRPGPMGQITPVIFLNLPPEAGEYELAVSVRDEVGAGTLEVVEPFTVARG